MRPLRLTLDGFRSYAAPTTFDFRERRLVGVVGPIGSGKSTILDAVTFALFGKTPSQAAATRSLIHQRADEGKVELWFESEGQIWRVVRALRRRGQSGHEAARYRSVEAIESGEKPLERVLQKAEVDARMQEVLGLDFDTFGRSILLAQNRFAELLRATPAERDGVLKGVFGFDKVETMHGEAKARRDGLARDLEEFDRRKSEMTRERERIAELTALLEAAEARVQALEKIAEPLAAADRAAGAAQVQLESTESRLTRLDEQGANLPEAETTEGLLASVREASESIVLIRAAADEKARASAAAQADRDRLIDLLGGRDKLDLARRTQQEWRSEQQRFDLLAEQVSVLDTRQSAMEKERTELQVELQAATEQLDLRRDEEKSTLAQFERAARELRTVERSDMAGTLRTELSEGAPCPVCEQLVLVVPPAVPAELHVHVAARDEAHDEHDRARKSLHAQEVAVTRLDEAARARAAAAAAVAEEIELAVRDRDESARRAADAERRLAGLLAGAEGRSLDEVVEELAQLEDRAAQAGRAAAESQKALDQLTTRAKADQERLSGLAAELNRLAGALGAEVSANPTPEAVAVAIASVRRVWTEQRRAAERERSALAELIATQRSNRQDLMATVGLAWDDDFDSALRSAEVARASHRTNVERSAERLAEAPTLDQRVKETAVQRDIYDELAADLTPSRFLRYLLEEERRTLARLGSERFEELSGGRYRFSDTGDFKIVDLTAAEEERKADSLSGGETFLASLALALALAEIVGRGGGRLDAFFLDEGFGSLDSEHLDLAMAGIERLVTDHPNRLVVVVSHVDEMKQRIEDLIELDKDPATGATLVRRA